jgi:hypothetical protein
MRYAMLSLRFKSKRAPGKSDLIAVRRLGGHHISKLAQADE